MTNIMDLTILRGFVEKIIDNMLSVDSLSNTRIIFESIKSGIKNPDDAMFGYVYGNVIGKLDSMYTVINRNPTKEDLHKIVESLLEVTQSLMGDVVAREERKYFKELLNKMESGSG